MTEIERILNDAMALTNINNGKPLRNNDDLCRHPIISLLVVVNDAAPWLFAEALCQGQTSALFPYFL